MAHFDANDPRGYMPGNTHEPTGGGIFVSANPKTMRWAIVIVFILFWVVPWLFF